MRHPSDRSVRTAPALSTIVAAMGRPFVKKPLAVLGTLGTMAAVWWFALRPRFRKH